jgi:hypothetical protein
MESCNSPCGMSVLSRGRFDIVPGGALAADCGGPLPWRITVDAVAATLFMYI